ncbi:MAG: Crp/Fnr family transcriptional regulator [Sphingobium sp.]
MTPTIPVRLSEFIDLPEEDRDILSRTLGTPRRVPKLGLIRQQGDPVDHVFILTEGWVASCVDLRDGQRQIVKLHIQGDVLGAPSMALTQAAETLLAITAATVRPIALRDFARLFFDAPRAAVALFLSAQQERVFLMDRITTIGRQSALRRLASFLIHVQERLKVAGMARDGRIEWPLTQQHLADLLGLTSVHVNRTLSALEKQGLIQRTGHGIILKDVEALRNLGGLPARQWICEPEWLPPSPRDLKQA